MSLLEAELECFFAGTTIGYGDKTPSSDMGKVFVALYAIFAVQVMAGLLEPAKRALESLCHSPKQLPTETKRD